MTTTDIARDTFGAYAGRISGSGQALMGADTLLGNAVYNKDGESLGDIKEFMTDMASSKVAHAGLPSGGLLGMGDKPFAVPGTAKALHTPNKRFTLSVPKASMKDAPGFENTSAAGVHEFHGTPCRSF